MKQNYFKLFFIWCIGVTLLKAQTTELFEDESIGGSSFMENGVLFNATSNSPEPYDVSNIPGGGWNGTFADNQLLDTGTGKNNLTPTDVIIKRDDGNDYTIKSFYVFLADNPNTGIFNGTGTLTVKGTKSNVEVFSFVKSSGFSDVETFSPNNGYTFIDMATEGGSDYSNTNIDTLEIITSGDFDYMAIDAFIFGEPAATTPPTFTALADLCIDSGVQSGLGGGSPVGGTYSGIGVTDDGNGMTYSFDPAVAGAGVESLTYTTSGGSANDDVEVFGLPTVTFTALSDLCINGGVQSSLSGGSPSGGTYSGAGVIDNAGTYAFDPAVAGVGVHTITYSFTDANGCSASATDMVEVFSLDNASFNYNASVYFTAGSDPTPTITGVTGGTFNSTMGLSLSSSDGVIDLSESTPGDYTITYTTGGTCPNSATTDITINESNNAPSFDLPMNPNQTISEDAGAQTTMAFATNIEDNNATAQVLNFSVANDNNALFSVQPDIDETTGNLTYTPAADAFGSTTVTVSLSDDGGTANGGDDTSADQTFTITVDQVNDTTPVITGITDDNGVSGTDFITNDNTLSVTGTAEPNSVITFSVDGNPIPSFVASALTNAAGVFVFDNPGGLPDGTSSFVATASLGGISLDSAPQSVTIDTEDPTVMISTTSSDPTDDNPIPVTVTFSQEVDGFESSDIAVTNGAVQDFSTADNVTFTFNLVPASTGTVEVNVAAGSATDIAGNDNVVSNTLSLEYSPTLSNDTFDISTLVSVETVVGDELVINGSIAIVYVKIFDLSGVLVANSTNVSSLASGVYIAVVETEKRTLTEKIIKK